MLRQKPKKVLPVVPPPVNGAAAKKNPSAVANATVVVAHSVTGAKVPSKVEEGLDDKLERILNLQSLDNFVPSAAYASQVSDSVVAHVRICSLGANAFMVFIQDHHYELREALVFGKTYVKPDGNCGHFPSVCQYVSYMVS